MSNVQVNYFKTYFQRRFYTRESRDRKGMGHVFQVKSYSFHIFN